MNQVFVLRVLFGGSSEFSETARYLDFISTKWKILSVKAPYKGMSSFQRGKDNNRVEMLLYLKIGIAKVCSKFDGVYYLIMNVIAVFMENIHCGAVSSAQFHASMLATNDINSVKCVVNTLTE